MSGPVSSGGWGERLLGAVVVGVVGLVVLPVSPDDVQLGTSQDAGGVGVPRRCTATSPRRPRHHRIGGDRSRGHHPRVRSRPSGAAHPDERARGGNRTASGRPPRRAHLHQPPQERHGTRGAWLLAQLGDCRSRYPTPQALISLAGCRPPPVRFGARFAKRSGRSRIGHGKSGSERSVGTDDAGVAAEPWGPVGGWLSVGARKMLTPGCPAGAQSGKATVVSFRYAVDKQLRGAVMDFAGDSHHANPRAADLYWTARHRGKSPRRGLGYRCYRTQLSRRRGESQSTARLACDSCDSCDGYFAGSPGRRGALGGAALSSSFASPSFTRSQSSTKPP